ncbi:hypothetical protein BDW60DRAFT_212666 [Aspergillus nidulans var. acristatus]
MPVILDNIQFYHGPSKPEKPPYFAFNSKEKGSNTLLSGEQPPFSNEQVSSAADDPTIVPTCFIPPAAKAEDVTHQHAVGSPNFFDFELSRCQGSATPLLGTLEASHRDACPSLQRLYCHYRDNPDEEMPGDSLSSFGADSSKSAGLVVSDVFPRPKSSCTTPPQPPQSPSIPVLSLEAAISHPGVMQSHVAEDVQWGHNQPSYRAYFESFSPAHAWDMSDVSTAFGEHSSNTPLSSILSCSDVAFNNRNDISSYVSPPEPEDCPDNHSGNYEGASQARLISGYSPRTVDELSPSGPADSLHVNLPDLMDLEQADGREFDNSHSKTPSIQGDKKQDTTRNVCYPSVAVVIPPPRPRIVRSLRSRPKPVALEAYESGSSEDVDDSSDEDFMTDTIQTELPHVEDSVEEKHGPPSTTASYHPSETSFGSSRHCCDSRDVVGRAILTIETRGSEPTFFFTLVPDNVPSTSYVPAHSPPRSSEKAGNRGPFSWPQVVCTAGSLFYQVKTPKGQEKPPAKSEAQKEMMKMHIAVTICTCRRRKNAPVVFISDAAPT